MQVSELERRRLAVLETRARYKGRAFSWRAGTTCIHLARFHAKAMGHRPPKVPRIRSALGARRELAAMGHGSVSDLMNTMFQRIAPSAMLLGDVAAVASEDGLDALFINAGPRKFFGWREDAPDLVVLDIGLAQITGAWRL